MKSSAKTHVRKRQDPPILPERCRGSPGPLVTPEAVSDIKRSHAAGVSRGVSFTNFGALEVFLAGCRAQGPLSKLVGYDLAKVDGVFRAGCVARGGSARRQGCSGKRCPEVTSPGEKECPAVTSPGISVHGGGTWYSSLGHSHPRRQRLLCLRGEKRQHPVPERAQAGVSSAAASSGKLNGATVRWGILPSASTRSASEDMTPSRPLLGAESVTTVERQRTRDGGDLWQGTTKYPHGDK